jgi:hypothetical protein
MAEPSGSRSRSSTAVLERARAALDDLASLDLDRVVCVSELSDCVQALQQLRGTLEAAEARVLARWDTSGEWRVDGAKTAAAWLAWKQRIPISVARQRLRHARVVRDLPEIGAAWRDGEIDRAHVSTLLGVRTERTRNAFERDHQTLLEGARTIGFVDFKAACERWELIVDPDGAEQGADEERHAREVHLNETFGGTWFGKLRLDPISGEIVNTTLRLIEKDLFDADWAAAKERLGREPTILELDRTPAQRRADALVEMAILARTAPADGRRPAPLFSVLVGYETFAGPLLELFNRTVITPGTAARWLTEADVERVVFDGPSRVIDVGATRRFFTGALRRAIEVRDRRCFHPSCDEAPLFPQIDHIQPASEGGATTQQNGRLGCGFHNRWRNHHPDEAGDHGTPDIGDPDAGPDPPDPE